MSKQFSLLRAHYEFVSRQRQGRRFDDATQIFRKMVLDDVKKQIFDFKDFKALGKFSNLIKQY